MIHAVWSSTVWIDCINEQSLLHSSESCPKMSCDRHGSRSRVQAATPAPQGIGFGPWCFHVKMLVWKQMLWEKPWETGVYWRTSQRISLHLLRRREAKSFSQQYARHIKRLLLGIRAKSRAVNAGRSGTEIPSRVPDGGVLTAIPSPSRPMCVHFSIATSTLRASGRIRK